MVLRPLGLRLGAQRVQRLQDHLRCPICYEFLPFLKIPVEGGTESGGSLGLRVFICEMGKFSGHSRCMEEGWV